MIGADAIGDGGERRVEPNGHVAATDVESDTGDTDLLLVGDHTADRLGVAEMAVGADHAGHDAADAHAIAHLRDRGFVVVAEYFKRAVLEFGLLRPHRRNALRRFRSLPHQMFLPGGIAIGAPRRH